MRVDEEREPTETESSQSVEALVTWLTWAPCGCNVALALEARICKVQGESSPSY